jgi:HAD superfamily hydrolase (TIGR01509 family)
MTSVAERSPAREAAQQQGTAAMLFDFDGTLWDPETLIYQAHAELFAAAGAELGFDLWTTAVGRIGVDMWRQLGLMTGRPVDKAALTVRLERRLDELLGQIGPRPGVAEILEAVDTLRLPRAIVSNSRREWVTRYSRQCGIAGGWCTVQCADGDLRRAKPSPELYLAALAKLSVPPQRAIAFEDSPSGVRAAKAAGIKCVVVANPVTRTLDLDEAHLRFESFEHFDLAQVLDKLG